MPPAKAAPATDVINKHAGKQETTCARRRQVEVETLQLNFISSRPSFDQTPAFNPKTPSVIYTKPYSYNRRCSSGCGLLPGSAYTLDTTGIATHVPSPFPSVSAPLRVTQEIAQLFILPRLPRHCRANLPLEHRLRKPSSPPLDPGSGQERERQKFRHPGVETDGGQCTYFEMYYY